MKVLGIFFVAACATYFASMEARNQQKTLPKTAKPIECSVCGGTSFEFIYADIYDRRAL